MTEDEINDLTQEKRRAAMIAVFNEKDEKIKSLEVQNKNLRTEICRLKAALQIKINDSDLSERLLAEERDIINKLGENSVMRFRARNGEVVLLVSDKE